MAAYRLMQAGARVLMIERGSWVERGPSAWRDDSSLAFTPSYARDIRYSVIAEGRPEQDIGSYACVGGPSVFYGGTSFRYRVEDFIGDADVIAASGAAWPCRYPDIEPYYTEAEALLSIAGDDSCDPTAPPRSAPFPQSPAPLAPISKRIVAAAQALKLSPFSLPLAIHYGASPRRPLAQGSPRIPILASSPSTSASDVFAANAARAACVTCSTCDTYACAIEAKNDIATMMIRPLLARGLVLWTDTVAVRLEESGQRVRRLYVHRKDSGVMQSVEADLFVLAAGALGTPHLILSSKLEEHSPARGSVGRYLMRHNNAMVFGGFASKPNPERRFHKQIAIHDYYFGDRDARDVMGMRKLGGIQQVMPPSAHLVMTQLSWKQEAVVRSLVEHSTGLLCIAEDQPQSENRVSVDWSTRDSYGLPRLVIHHRYSARDQQALAALVRRAKRVLRKAGAWVFYTHQVSTFSHAVGTVRAGVDPATSPLDEDCRFRGLHNLWITCGSALPLSAAVNPSLTIAANALRVSDRIVATMGKA